MKVLVVQLKMIGDVLMSTAICEAVKARFPSSELHYLIYPNAEAVTRNNPHIDRIILFDPKRHKGFSGLRQLGNELKNERYDAIIDAYCKPESLIPLMFSRKSLKIGIKKFYTDFIYDESVERQPGLNALTYRLKLAEQLTKQPFSIPFPTIYLTEKERSEAKTKLSEHLSADEFPVMISCMGSSEAKSMPAATMAQLMDAAAAQKGAKLVLNYIPSQANDAREIFLNCLPETQDKIVFDFYCESLRDFIAVLSHCRYLIGNEGGAVNMAKALNVPTFCVYSPQIGNGWDLLEETGRHASVHLKDYRPDLFENTSKKEIQKKSSAYYQELRFEFFEDKLTSFLNQSTP